MLKYACGLALALVCGVASAQTTSYGVVLDGEVHRIYDFVGGFGFEPDPTDETPGLYYRTVSFRMNVGSTKLFRAVLRGLSSKDPSPLDISVVKVVGGRDDGTARTRSLEFTSLEFPDLSKESDRVLRATVKARFRLHDLETIDATGKKVKFVVAPTVVARVMGGYVFNSESDATGFAAGPTGQPIFAQSAGGISGDRRTPTHEMEFWAPPSSDPDKPAPLEDWFSHTPDVRRGVALEFRDSKGDAWYLNMFDAYVVGRAEPVNTGGGNILWRVTGIGSVSWAQSAGGISGD